MNKITLILIAFLLAACGTSQVAQGQNGVSKKARALFNKAITAFQYGEYDEAEQLFKQTIKKYNGYVDAYDGLAKTYQEQRKYTEAIATYRKVLEFDPSHYFALYELGKLYQSTENLDSAKYFFKFFLKENAGQDQNTAIAKRALVNIAFSEDAMKNPVDISPISISNSINTHLEEYSPAFSIDENTLYFTNRDPKYQNEDIFYSTKKEGVWQTGKNIGSPINTVDNEGAFSVSSDGNYIFFTSCSRSGGKGQCDIWLTMNKNGIWTTPANLQEPINSRSWESQPSISSNGKQLY
ncbi:MAG: tetratricopeptide repeat protein, partial [Bacteroidia bacterium]|nr:tetratricopeptide repeat protein [Bacteroidia bacterium]NNJ55672.1 tetratricopeptide repeat protein [Bacteroidia bacterium]